MYKFDTSTIEFFEQCVFKLLTKASEKLHKWMEVDGNGLVLVSCEWGFKVSSKIDGFFLKLSSLENLLETELKNRLKSINAL